MPEMPEDQRVILDNIPLEQPELHEWTVVQVGERDANKGGDITEVNVPLDKLNEMGLDWPFTTLVGALGGEEIVEVQLTLLDRDTSRFGPIQFEGG